MNRLAAAGDGDVSNRRRVSLGGHVEEQRGLLGESVIAKNGGLNRPAAGLIECQVSHIQPSLDQRKWMEQRQSRLLRIGQRITLRIVKRLDRRRQRLYQTGLRNKRECYPVPARVYVGRGEDGLQSILGNRTFNERHFFRQANAPGLCFFRFGYCVPRLRTGDDQSN